MRRLLVRFRLAALNSVERDATGEFQSGQMGQTVNLLSLDFGGSNPSSPTPKAGLDDDGKPVPAVLP